MRKSLFFQPVMVFVIFSLLFSQAGIVGAAAPVQTPRLSQEALTVAAQPASARTSAAAPRPAAYVPGWNTILNESFEASSLPYTWLSYDANNNDLYTWGISSYKPYSGAKSVWVASGGVDPLNPAAGGYQDNMNAWLIYGPFSLVGMNSAYIQFQYWNDSEPDYDFFWWEALADGKVISGTPVSGFSDGWQSVVFDLTSLVGQDMVYITFKFHSDESFADEYKGAFVDDVLIEGFVPNQPDLAPFAPSGWTFPIVPSRLTGTTIVDTSSLNRTYIDWQVRNIGESTSAEITNCLYLDDNQANCWTTNGLNASDSVTVLDWPLNQALTAGPHKLKLVADVNNAVDEANENNNTWEYTYNWQVNCDALSFSSPPASSPIDSAPALIDDAMILPPAAHQFANGQQMSPPLAGSPLHMPGWWDTSVFMQDSVVVGIILPESAGSMEDWTPDETYCVVSEIQTGMNWWKTRGGARANLSFVYDVHIGVPISAEPIDLSKPDHQIWVNQSLTSMGFQGQNTWDQTYNYLNSLRSQYHTQWATAIFVADSSNDSDDTFKGGPYSGFAYIGGPYIVMTRDNGGWGLGRMNWVAAHEFGHIFGAADQYYQEGYGGCASTIQRYGYLGVANSNCAHGNPNQVPSIMISNGDALDATAAGQIGWQDSNGNGINDVVDTHPVFSQNRYQLGSAARTTLTFTGLVTDQAWPHTQCGFIDLCAINDININTVAAVFYQVDGGDWVSATAVDGAFDMDREQFAFTTGTLDLTAHTINIKATNSRGISTTCSMTVSIENVGDIYIPMVTR